jgi:hypothetical protein
VYHIEKGCGRNSGNTKEVKKLYASPGQNEKIVQ